jgi:hypothetical protein
VRVLNGTLRTGLAADVAHGLHKRLHVPIGRVGNTGHLVKGDSIVRYPKRLAAEAANVAVSVYPPASLHEGAGHLVELDIGKHYRRLATEVQARTAKERLFVTSRPTVTPSPSPCTSASPS